LNSKYRAVMNGIYVSCGSTDEISYSALLSSLESGLKCHDCSRLARDKQTTH